MRQRLLDEAQGNPLALLELPPALSGPQRAAWQALPAVLPLTERLQALFAGRISGLPSTTRELLLLAVLAGAADYALLDRTVDRAQGTSLPGVPAPENLAVAVEGGQRLVNP